jgi:hypothetical protein
MTAWGIGQRCGLEPGRGLRPAGSPKIPKREPERPPNRRGPNIPAGML